LPPQGSDVVAAIGWAGGEHTRQAVRLGDEVLDGPEGQWFAGVDGEALLALAVERLLDDLDRFAGEWWRAMAGGVVDLGGAEEVEEVRVSPSAQRDVAPLPEQLVGVQHETPGDGRAPGLVDGGGVAVKAGRKLERAPVDGGLTLGLLQIRSGPTAS
jgi:hypothetical protein